MSNDMHEIKKEFDDFIVQLGRYEWDKSRSSIKSDREYKICIKKVLEIDDLLGNSYLKPAARSSMQEKLKI